MLLEFETDDSSAKLILVFIVVVVQCLLFTLYLGSRKILFILLSNSKCCIPQWLMIVAY